MQSVNVSMENFQTEVVDASQNLPVVLLFWAEQVPQSVQVKNLVEQVLADYQGKASLALSDVAQDQTLAPRLQVQGLPSIRIIHKGAVAEQVDGPIDETQLRTIMDGLTQSSIEALQGDLDQLMANGDFAAASAILQQSIQDEPNNQSLRVELADVLVRKGDIDDARTVLASISEETDGRSRPQNRWNSLKRLQAWAAWKSCRRWLSQTRRSGARYALAVLQVVAEEYEGSLLNCLDILRENRSFVMILVA